MEITLQGDQALGLMLDYWQAWFPGRALTLLGEELVEDAQGRLENDDTAPDGRRWDRWSDAYAATRSGGDKLLYQEGSGALAKSLDSVLRGSKMIVGSPLDYAQTHQFGSLDKTTPQREYVGLSRTLERELDRVLGIEFERGWQAYA